MRPTTTSAVRRALVPALALCLAAAGGAATACDSGDDAGDKKIKLTVGLFGDFGFKPLYEEYRKTHQNVDIEERVAEYAPHHQNLAAHLATNNGAADIEAVEIGYLSQFTPQPGKFHNLADSGLAAREGEYLPWKWKQGLSKDGKTLVGLGTDVGSMAMCYRRDLFANAGLPTERGKVSGLWPTWEEYVATGKRYHAAPGAKGTFFFESAGNMFRAIVGQAPLGVYDTSDNVIVSSNPDVRKAWDLTVQAIQAGMSNKLTAWTPEWTAAFGKGTFATIICPAWMTAYIENNAKDASGKWDVAAAPNGGAGNVGGSHLVVPKQGKNAQAAAELVNFLTSAASQTAVFKKTGNFPSLPSLYDQADVKSFSKAYFNDAPLGQIFGDGAKALKPQYLGPKEGDVMTAVGQGLGRIEQGQQDPTAAWDQAVKDAEKLK